MVWSTRRRRAFSASHADVFCFTRAEALAISTARAAVASTEARLKSSRGREPPSPIGEHTNTDSLRLRIRGTADLSIFCSQSAAAVAYGTSVRIGCPFWLAMFRAHSAICFMFEFSESITAGIRKLSLADGYFRLLPLQLLARFRVIKEHQGI